LWQVSASTPEGETISPTPPEPEAMFRILEDKKYQEIQRAKAADAPHLVLASLYAEGGLVSEARKELEILRAENPKSKLVQDLINSLPK
jgi:hypothetical protein